MKLTTLIKSVTLGSLLAISASSVQAMTLDVKDVDLNADGKVTEAEILNVVKAHFLAMDKNSDSVVTSNEWYAGDHTKK